MIDALCIFVRRLAAYSGGPLVLRVFMDRTGLRRSLNHQGFGAYDAVIRQGLQGDPGKTKHPNLHMGVSENREP